MLDLLHSEVLPPEARSMLDTARNSADALLTLINDVLDFSKIDAGKLTLEKIDVELRPLAEEVATLFTGQANAKGVEVTCAVHNDVPAVLGGDPTRLRQIMVNLVGNAVKFTARGEVLLGVQVRGEGVDGKVPIQILVQDTGIGMSEEAQKNLFAAFTQADASTTRKFGGTGLGLAITKRLVDAMGGTIKVKSEPDKGSIFSVLIPLAVRPREKPVRANILQGLKALIVDDNPTNRCILEHYLQHEEAKYESVSSARAGLDPARAAVSAGAPFDVVLLDYQMPEMDGSGFLRELRADPMLAHLNCIVLSSLGDRDAEADELGVSAWLTKPVRRAQLRSTLAVASGRAEDDRKVAKHASVQTMHTGARVLLVEDNAVNKDVARRMLRLLGIDTVAVMDGSEAVQRVHAERFDLVLMDCQMPVMDGYEATAAIRAWESQQSAEGGRPRLPIVAMTANALHGDRESCLAAGMDDYIAKPIKRDALAAALARWLPAAAHGAAVAMAVAAALPRDASATAHDPDPSSDEAPRSDSALDMAAVAQLSELMSEDLADVIETYLSNTPIQLASIATAIEQRDYAILRRAAHSLKSSSQSVGAVVVGRVAEVLEMLAPAQSAFDNADRLLAALRAAFEVVEPRLSAVAAAEHAKPTRRATTEGHDAQEFVKVQKG
jgi:CheY-like chemotaxis protein/HPt (histidine-containing phosphotransfer) domain-containing protein